MRMNLDHVASGGDCEFALAVNMLPTKVCPQCKAAVRHVNAVIMSFDPNEKQSVICERKL